MYLFNLIQILVQFPSSLHVRTSQSLNQCLLPHLFQLQVIHSQHFLHYFSLEFFPGILPLPEPSRVPGIDLLPYYGCLHLSQLWFLVFLSKTKSKV